MRSNPGYPQVFVALATYCPPADHPTYTGSGETLAGSYCDGSNVITTWSFMRQ